MRRIEQGDSDYPATLLERLGHDAPRLYAMGEVSLLRRRLLGLVCSIQCPGSIVIQTLDAARALRVAGVAVVGGFHSPMEKECLEILLRGDQPVILCAARGLVGLRMGQQARRAVLAGQVLVLSPFAESVRRTTADQAVQRNHLVAALADALWAPHAVPDGKAWATVRAALARRQPVFAFEDEANGALFELGAQPFSAFLNRCDGTVRGVSDVGQNSRAEGNLA